MRVVALAVAQAHSHLMTSIQRFFKTLFNATVGTALALVVIFEEWGWEPLARVLARLAQLPVWARLERWIASLPPWAALLTFAAPTLALFPIKLLALYWIGQGHALAGLLLILAAKLIGTAILARLFGLTQPALMHLAWFARWYPRWKHWKDTMVAHVKASRPWHAAQAALQHARQTGRRWWHAIRRNR